MTEHPITMSAESIRAIQAGLKHETRRPIVSVLGLGRVTEFGASDTPGYDFAMRDRQMRWNEFRREELLARCPYGQPGDKLRVREKWSPWADEETKQAARDSMFDEPLPVGPVVYAADFMDGCPPLDVGGCERWRPSIFMPRWASRFILPLTIVRAERLWDITEEDAIAEGFGDTVVAEHFDLGYEERPIAYLRRSMFVSRWQSLNAKRGYPWDSNPWVWVLGWEQVEGPTQ
jgi:hypothetical protein